MRIRVVGNTKNNIEIIYIFHALHRAGASVSSPLVGSFTSCAILTLWLKVFDRRNSWSNALSTKAALSTVRAFWMRSARTARSLLWACRASATARSPPHPNTSSSNISNRSPDAISRPRSKVSQWVRTWQSSSESGIYRRKFSTVPPTPRPCGRPYDCGNKDKSVTTRMCN